MTENGLTLQQQRDRSALVVALPELAPLIEEIRRQATEDGPAVPPHITLYSPFFAPGETTDGVIQRVRAVISSRPGFELRVERIDRFPGGVWYLVPEPAAPLQEMIRLLRAEFVEIAPYWDRYPEVVLHITLADEAVVGTDIVSAFVETVSRSLPVRCSVDVVTWLQRRTPSPAPWDTVATFPLETRG